MSFRSPVSLYLNTTTRLKIVPIAANNKAYWTPWYCATNPHIALHMAMDPWYISKYIESPLAPTHFGTDLNIV